MAFLLGFFWDNNFQNHHIQIAPYLQDLGGGRVACGKNLGAQKSQACIVSTTFCRQPVLNINGSEFYAYVGNSIFNINHGKLSFQHQCSTSIFYVRSSQFSGFNCLLFDMKPFRMQKSWSELLTTHGDWQTHGQGTSLWPWWFGWDRGAPRSTPKWMVKIIETPIKMDDLGVPLFSETSKWLVNDEDMGHKERKRCLYMVPDFFWNMKDWWIQLMFFFGTIWQSPGGVHADGKIFWDIKLKWDLTQIGRCPASRRVFVRNFSKGKLRAHEWIPPQCLRKRFQDRYMYIKFY